MSDERLPSSFDDDPEFFEEGWLGKLGRRLKEEPLIPLGCAATCYALWRASKSIRQGDSYQTNKMFRARIYAQGFTLLAVLAGGLYYKDNRLKRAEFDKAIAEKRLQEKRDAWIKELEARDREDKDWKERHEAIEKAAKEAVEGNQIFEKVSNTAQEQKDGKRVDEAAKSMLDDVEWRKEGVVMAAVRDFWKRR